MRAAQFSGVPPLASALRATMPEQFYDGNADDQSTITWHAGSWKHEIDPRPSVEVCKLVTRTSLLAVWRLSFRADTEESIAV